MYVLSPWQYILFTSLIKANSDKLSFHGTAGYSLFTIRLQNHITT